MKGSVFILLLTSATVQLVFSIKGEFFDNSILSTFGSNTSGDASSENETEYTMLLSKSSLNLTVSDKRVIGEGTITSTNESVHQSDGGSAFDETTSNFTEVTDSLSHEQLIKSRDASSSANVTDFVDVELLADEQKPTTSGDPSSKCPKDDEDTVVLFPHPTLPGSFYKCSHGAAYQLSCPAGLIYNPDISVCDWI